MNDKLPEVWRTRDYPILKATTEYIDQGLGPDPAELAKVTGLTSEQIQLGLRALERRGLVKVAWSVGGPGWIEDVSGDAYLLTGLHPDGHDALEALASMFQQAADQATDPGDKSRLRRVASALGDVGGQFAASVMAAFVARLGGFG